MLGTISLRSMDNEQKIADDILNLANNIKKGYKRDNYW